MAASGEEQGVAAHFSINPVHHGAMSYTEAYEEERFGPFNAGICSGCELTGWGTPGAYSGPYVELETPFGALGLEAGLSTDGPYFGLYASGTREKFDAFLDWIRG